MEMFSVAVNSMERLNKKGAELMKKYKAHGATDITGFGLLGHVQALARNHKNEVSFVIHKCIFSIFTHRFFNQTNSK